MSRGILAESRPAARIFGQESPGRERDDVRKIGDSEPMWLVVVIRTGVASETETNRRTPASWEVRSATGNRRYQENTGPKPELFAGA